MTFRFPFVEINGGYWIQTTTDEQGKYKLKLFHSANYNLFLLDDDIVAPAVTVSKPRDDKPVVADIQIEKPIEVKGRLIDFDTGKPLAESVRISWHGPDRPRSGSPVRGTYSKADGSFTLLMAAGTNRPYVSFGELDGRIWSSTSVLNGEETLKEIEVAEGHSLDLKIVVKKLKRE